MRVARPVEANSRRPVYRAEGFIKQGKCRVIPYLACASLSGAGPAPGRGAPGPTLISKLGENITLIQRKGQSHA
jgi:hypothetical protein